jgi:hypothetical protein
MDPWPLTPWLIKPFSASGADDSLYPLPLQVPRAWSRFIRFQRYYRGPHQGACG